MRPDNALTSALMERHPADAARVLEGLPAGAVAELLAGCDKAVAAGVLNHMIAEVAGASLQDMEVAAAAGRLEAMRPGPAARALLAMDPEDAAARLDRLPDAVRAVVRTRQKYPDGTAGARMDTRRLQLPDDITAGQAVDRIQRSDQPVACHLCVVNREHRLAGLVETGALMRAKPAVALRSLLIEDAPAVGTHADLVALVSHPGWRRFPSLPVEQADGSVVGMLDFVEAQRAAGHAGEGAMDELVQGGLSVASAYWITVAEILKTVLELGACRRGDAR